VLLGLLTGVLLWVGNLVGGPTGLTIAIIFAVLMNFFSYWFSDKIALAVYRAKQITEKDDQRLYRLVREVSGLAKVQMPRVYVIPSSFSNAFACGRSEKHAAVAFSEGILKLLNDSELKGVIAHEIAHIKNKDILISSIAATIAGVISYVATMAQWAAIFGGFGRERNGPNFIELLALIIITPLIAALIQFAISRSREYIADASGASYVHSGLGLASALEKLEADIAKKPLAPHAAVESTAHLFIVNPFRKGGFVNLLSTHPPMSERIKRLRAMRP